MPLKTMRSANPYPRYLYHKDHDAPIRVDTKADETPLLNQGWVTRRLFKEFPKMVEGQTVYSRKEENRLRKSLDLKEQEKKKEVKAKKAPPWNLSQDNTNDS